MGSPAGKRVLLTGGTGMIGANLAPRLIADGYQVFMLVRSSSSLLRLKSIEDQIQLLYGDLMDEDSLQAAFKESQPQVVFHLASTRFNISSMTTRDHMSVNVMGTVNLLETLKNHPGVKVIFTGSTAAYGYGSQHPEDAPLLPGTILGASKACASILLQAYSRLHRIETVESRLFTPFGSWEHSARLIPHTILSALSRKDVTMSAGDQERDFIYVDDAVEALMLCATQSLPSGPVFNIGSGVGTPIKKVAGRILELMGNPVKLLLGTLETRSDEIMEMRADVSAARDRLGWRNETSLDEGLRRSIAWVTENRELTFKLA